MERRAFLKVALGVVAGAAVVSTAAQAAPLMPLPSPENANSPTEMTPQPAVADQNDLDAARIEEVRWGRRRRWGWRRRRFWGHRRRRFWGRRRWRRRRFWL